MTVFECRKCIREECKEHTVCDQYAHLKAEELKEQVMKDD